MKAQGSFAILAILWFTCFWNYSCQQVAISLLPTLQESLSLSTAAIGFLVSLFFLGFSFSFLVSGYLCNRLGRVKTIFLCIPLVMLFMLSISFSTDFLTILVLEPLLGFGTGLYHPAALSLLSSLFSSRERGKYLGVHEAAVPAGMTVGPVFVGLMLNFGLGWNQTFQLWIVPGAVILLSQFLLLKVKEGRQQPSFEDEPSADAVHRLVPWAAISLLILVAAYFLRNVANSEVTLLPEYWVSDFGVEVGTAAFIYGIMRVFAIFGQVGVGYLSDIFGRLRVLIIIQTLQTFLLISTSYLEFGPLLFASYAMFSILQNSFMPVMFALVSDHSHPKKLSKNIGIVMSIGGIATVISPTILGLLAQSYSFRIAWLYPIATAFMAIPLLLLLRNSLKARI